MSDHILINTVQVINNNCFSFAQIYICFLLLLYLVNNDTNDNDINVDNSQSNDITYSDPDDLYGQTREIILFAERGLLKFW